LHLLDQLIQSQAVILATNHILSIVSVTFVFAALAVWLAPKPKVKVDGSGAH
jgi:DHA2 family multidrug resistance protein